jgi:hypothetical protein
MSKHRVAVLKVVSKQLSILSTHSIEPDKGYWRNTRGDPGRWPGPQQTG